MDPFANAMANREKKIRDLAAKYVARGMSPWEAYEKACVRVYLSK